MIAGDATGREAGEGRLAKMERNWRDCHGRRQKEHRKQSLEGRI